MENTSQQSNRLHPLIATAAGAVIVASLVGVAAMTGMLPAVHGSDATPLAQRAVPTQMAATTAPAYSTTQAAAPAVVRPRIHTVSHITHVERAYSPDWQQHVAFNGNVGTVESITPVTQPGQASGLGAVGGAVAGGLLGHQIGGGRGRTVATVLGALGGGVAGNMVEQRVRSDTDYQVRVRMEDGSSRVVTYHQQPDVGVGQRVRVEHGGITGSV
ncbi:glycine zipper 2TM domain-containing protein [Cupriavidus basilensis]|uniref:Glycine zipper 2TM domain-containing protein n=1 Tax=Cupriavidus basilensis TaxID=68895 RepID=A0ABT6AS77_9BURK|nr:glycine zipper 2TM domain-containing protein [Cupriavidus basilensis]MDF3835443.1 glycine zipper 2TM domain-containing protein [Cupriavidus basilensis]